MQRPRLFFGAAAIVGACLLVLAFLAAPRSCEGGLEVYFWAGVVALVALAALPFAARAGASAPGRVAWSAAFVAFGVGVWLAGLFAANVRIMCRLF